MDNKELPQEIVDKIKDTINILQIPVSYTVFFESGATISYHHYEPIIAEKEREIERVTELLKAEIMNNAYTYYIRNRANIHEANNLANDKWNIYKKEHNL